jgi:hypothetical protein
MRTVLVTLMPLAIASFLPLVRSQAQPTAAQFYEFYASFRAAVTNRDETRLQRMMASHFEFLRAANIRPADVFRALDQNNGQQWKNLQLAVQRGVPGAQSYGNHPARVLSCTPNQVIYNCYIVFEENNSGLWKWKGFVMPQK